jgi:hypothetical protein
VTVGREGALGRGGVARFPAMATGRSLGSNTPQLRLFDPRLTSGLREERLFSRLRCLAVRPPRHNKGMALTARASGRIFCGGDGGTSDGRVAAWSTQTGSLLCAATLEAPATCLAVVETVRPAAALRAGPLKRTGAADGFGCELIVWVGQSDGRIAVLAGGDLALRIVLGGHRGSLTCICSPGAPPSAPAVGASVVLSGGEDGAMRMWDAQVRRARTARPLQPVAQRLTFAVDRALPLQAHRRVLAFDTWRRRRPPHSAARLVPRRWREARRALPYLERGYRAHAVRMGAVAPPADG